MNPDDWYSAYPNADVTVRTYPDGGHDVQYRHLDQILLDISGQGDQILVCENGQQRMIDPSERTARPPHLDCAPGKTETAFQVRAGGPPQRRLPQAGPQVAAPDHRKVLTLPGIAVYTQSAPHKSEQLLLATSGVLCSNNNERIPCQSMTHAARQAHLPDAGRAWQHLIAVTPSAVFVHQHRHGSHRRQPGALPASEWSYDHAAHLLERAGFGGLPKKLHVLRQ